MGTGRTDEFRKDAVRIALTSGLTRRQVADDLGVGLSTLNKWVNAHRDTDVVSPEDRELALENERLRRENRILKEERDILKKGETIFRHWSEDNGRTSSSRAKSHEVQVRRGTARCLPDRPALSGHERQPTRIAGFPQPPCQPQATHGYGRSGAYPLPGSRNEVSMRGEEQSRLSLGSYGRPRMTEELKEVGIDVGHRRVGRLMRENGITVERTRKFKATADSDHTFNIAPNLLDRDFRAAGPNQKWAGDISYIWTREGWLYLAIILDLHSRRVIGWAVSNRMKRDLAIRALKMAIAFRAPPKGCIHHTDRGSQYCSHDYQKILRQLDFKVSMSSKDNCYDNAAFKTFFKTITAEIIWRRSWETRRQAEMAIFEYINGFYNPRHRRSALSWKSPVAFERKRA